MRKLAVSRRLTSAALRSALANPAPLVLHLLSPPLELPRLDLLRALAAFDGLLVAEAGGTLGTPLAEAALLCPLAHFAPGARLDLREALLGPLLLRLGRRGAIRLLSLGGGVVEADDVLLPLAPDDLTRSPLALAEAARLVTDPAGGPSASGARERAAFGLLLSAGDKREGVRAFRERRPARFDW